MAWNSDDPVELKFERDGLPIWYTGHSLGAALAILAASRKRPAALATFGAPIVVDDGNPAGRVDILMLESGEALVTSAMPSSSRSKAYSTMSPPSGSSATASQKTSAGALPGRPMKPGSWSGSQPARSVSRPALSRA